MEKNIQKILALKYRPQTFDELIDQDVMVRTIVNSIKFNKIPNAYLLTGIRGVGKTTTARIIAKALNCKKNFSKGEKCDTNEFCHCRDIISSRHLDVLEMDAASKTGIDDIRELIESSKYNPTSAKYKIFIIDEVHMLSKQAFNGLLKTLEEPPPHLKFVFATTEVKKIPVTIISRCQRFDLKRVSINSLFQHLKKITLNEKGDISEQALQLIAKVSEGSVRDSLSLLDRALIGYNAKKQRIDQNFVQEMLGIADRSQVIKLFEFVICGDEKLAIQHLRKMIDEGVEAKSILNDFLEIIYYITNVKNFGNMDFDLTISESHSKNIELISKKIDFSTLMMFWQFVLKGLEELNIVSNQILSLEMFIIRLLHLKGMPNYEEILALTSKNSNELNQETINKKSDDTNIDRVKDESVISKDQIKNIFQTKPKMQYDDPKLFTNKILDYESILNFEQLLHCVSRKKEIELKYDLEKNVSLVRFAEGQIDISFNEKLGKNFIRMLSEKLFEWTGKRWVITLTQEKGQKTYSEKKINEEKKMLDEVKREDFYKQMMESFPDADLLEVKNEK